MPNLFVSPEKKDFKNYQEEFDIIKEIITTLKNDGAYDNLRDFRTKKQVLKRHYNNIFDSNIGITSKTTRTDLFKSFLSRVTVELYKRKMSVPTFDVEPVNRAGDAYKEKRQASIVKALLEYFVRQGGYENILKESWEDQLAYGDRYMIPFIRNVKKSKKQYFGLRDVKSENLLIDPNCNSVQSENYLERAQYFGITAMYPEKNLVDRFGGWILDHAQEGFMIDSDSYPGYRNKQRYGKNIKYYEVLEIQEKSTGMEFVFVGGNAFPVIMHVDGNIPTISAEIQALIDDDDTPVAWSDEYKYKDSFGEPVLTLSGGFTFFDTDSPRNWGLVDKTAVLQVLHEITENLKIDNIIQRLDQTKFLIGGNDRTDKALVKYRQEKRTNRYAVWNIPTSLAAKNPPTPGVIKFDGLTAQEGTEITEGIYDLVKNVSGVDPQQLEVQKNTAVTQTQIVEEKSVEAVQDIAESNVPQYSWELRSFLAFIIGNEGFGLTDVKINFTDYNENFPEGDENASISISKAAKEIKEYQFEVIIDRSSLIKRSRFAEREQLLEFLGHVNPQATPEWFIAVSKSIAKIGGIELPDVDQESIQQMAPQGGNSQFKQSEQQQLPEITQ